MITVPDFVNFTTIDLKCTNKSEFPLNINKYRSYVNQINESIENDKNSLGKVKKGVKNIYNSGTTHCQNEVSFSELLEKLSQNEDGDFDVDGDKIATGLCKFAVVMRDLSTKYKQLMQNLNSLVVYPLDMYLKSDIKHDVRKQFDKALKDYEAKAEKLKKDRLSALNKENAATIYRPNGDDLFDFSEDLERERRLVQLQLCEVLIKVNEMKARKGAELVQQLIDYYRAQTNYFKDSLSMMEHMGMFMNDLVSHIDEIKNHHTDEIQLLSGVRKDLKSVIEKNKSSLSQHGPTGSQSGQTQVGYSLHQPQGNKAYGTSKDGWLLKRSEGVVKRVWQRRRVQVTAQSLLLYHGDDSKPPVTLPMLTCHIKLPSAAGGGDPASAGGSGLAQTGPASGNPGSATTDSFCFDLISNNRVYNFRAEDEKSYEEWVSVLSNAKAAVFEQAMSLDNNDDDDDNYSKDSNHSAETAASFSATPMLSNTSNGNSNNSNNIMVSSVISFGRHQANEADLSPSHYRKAIFKTIRRLEGNDKCADCGAADPDWVSVNLGVLICLECCGVHRDLGVHLSRTQSLKMDTFHLSQLLLPRFIGNKMFNEVFEAVIPDSVKPVPSDCVNRNDSVTAMQQRKNFIRSKYIDRKFVDKYYTDNPVYLRRDLLQSIQSMDIKSLLQTYGEGADMMTQFTLEDEPAIGGEMNSCIHQALAEAANNSDSFCSRGASQPSHKAGRPLSISDMRWSSDHSSVSSPLPLLVIVEFVLQNSSASSLKRVNARGDTILHQAVRKNQFDAVKIILRSGVVASELLAVKNNDQQTVFDVAGQLENGESMTELLRQCGCETEKEQYNESLDDLNIDWGCCFPVATVAIGDGSRRDDLSLSSQAAALLERNSKDRPSHARTESVSSNRSDLSSYVNFTTNHQNNSQQVTTLQHPPQEQTHTSKKHNTSSGSSTSGYKQFFSFNADQKIGLKTSSAPWKESGGGSGITATPVPPGMSTLPRKKSLKGPAPEPPAPEKRVSSSHFSLIRHNKPSSSISSNSSNNPPLAPKPKTRHSKKSHHQHNLSEHCLPTGGDYSTATLPRNMHSVHRVTSVAGASTGLSCGNPGDVTPTNVASIAPEAAAKFATLRDPRSDEYKPISGGNLKQSSHFSHSSDHIDVLLDVLEEPEKPLNAKEITPANRRTPMGYYDNGQNATANAGGSGSSFSQKLTIGDRAVAKYNCDAENCDELSFSKGQVIVVSNKSPEDGWWEGYLESDPSKVGMFPANFVERM